jgi:molecular chaperone DnaK (HSP70)
MGVKLAIDFGTTNSVVACWQEADEQAEIISLPHLSEAAVAERPTVIPSLLYVQDAMKPAYIVGQMVRDQGYDARKDSRLFRNFKRGIVTTPAPAPRDIDGRKFADRDAGRAFVQQVIAALPYHDSEIEQLVLTAPVAAFEGYLAWLNEVIDDIASDKIRVVDESTAAALGYAVTQPGAVVLVFDFGGGTLDLSLVQLPEHKQKAGGFLRKIISQNAAGSAARVIAKAGRIIGGSDIDQWLLAYVLQKTGLSTQSLGSAYAPLLTACERAKIHLSTQLSAEISFEADGRSHYTVITRSDLEDLLEQNGFYDALRRVVDKVMHIAQQRGIFREDIKYVLMVGGTSLMPSVQRALGRYFTDMAVRADKPFTAVAEGALQLAAGYGLEDYLIHSYGLRYYDPQTQAHAWDEIIPMGSAYPLSRPIELTVGAAHADQREMEFIIGEVDTDAIAMIEVKYEDGQAVFVAQASEAEQKIVAMNEKEALSILAQLNPPAKPHEERLRLQFSVDERRRLRLTAIDLHTGKTLLDNVAVVTLQ